MASGAYQSPAVTGTGNSSNTSLENPVLSWGHAQHHDNSRTSAVSTGHKLLACALLQFVQSLGGVPALVTKWGESLTPTILKPPDWPWKSPICLGVSCHVHYITVSPQLLPVCGFYQELKENVVNILQPCWHTVHGPYYFPWDQDTIDSQCYNSMVSQK